MLVYNVIPMNTHNTGIQSLTTTEFPQYKYIVIPMNAQCTGIVELWWLEPLLGHENLFETAVVRATEGYY